VKDFEVKDLKVTRTTSITAEQIRTLLCCAFEGGSNYWYEGLAPHTYPEGLTHEDYKEGGNAQDPDNYWHWCQLLPTTGGSVQFMDIESGETHILDGDKVKSGLQIMADRCPSHFNDFLEENDDAETGDVFLQCCVLGDLVYG